MSCIVADSECKGEVVDCPHCGNHKVCKEHLYSFQLLDEYTYKNEYTQAQWTYGVLHSHGAINAQGIVINPNIRGIGWFYDTYKYMLFCKNVTEAHNEQSRAYMSLSKSIVKNSFMKSNVNRAFEKNLVSLVCSFIK